MSGTISVDSPDMCLWRRGGWYGKGMGAHRLLERLFGPLPFARLAHVHALSTAADTFFAVSLAGSLFFNVSIDAARPRIILYLALSMAPFAIVAPFVGPWVDRFSRMRTGVISFTILARGILCLFVGNDLKSLLFYPEAFGVLVLGKAYSVAKSATVPGLVDDSDQLVAANARLSRLAGLAGALAAPLAAGLMALGNAEDVLRVGSLVYFSGAALALLIPSIHEEPTAQPQVGRSEVHFPSVILGASVVTALRASLGFLTFLIAFGLRRAGEPSWLYGLVIGAAGLGAMAATLVSPALKRHWLREEQLFVVALLLVSIVTFGTAWYAGPTAMVATGFFLGLAANLGRMAFDSLLQRDAPYAARGMLFARFETRFQLAWVVGALVPVGLSLDMGMGLLVLGVASTLALAACLAGVSIENRLVEGVRGARTVVSRRSRRAAAS